MVPTAVGEREEPVESAIVGKALYAGKFTLIQAIDVAYN
jgi:phosphoribosylformimino-5-aminoimidazole carboxamide ribonucleotide (ProFAR) isomerase